MLSQTNINRAIIIAFMMLVGFSFAKSINSGSMLGLALAVISLAAGVYFVYLLTRVQEQAEQE